MVAESGSVWPPMTMRFTLGLRKVAYENHDSCISCGKRFVHEDLYHLGYDANDDPMIVGNCCSHLLKETAARHGFHLRQFEVPVDDATLWRYMGLAKFISVLSMAALFFPKVDKLGDPFECAIGLGIHRDYFERACFERLVESARDAIQNPPPGMRRRTPEEEEQNLRSMIEDYISAPGIPFTARTFANCWHSSAHESEALWKLYGGTDGNAVAIRTTYRRLRNALLDRREVGDRYEIEIGKVKYVDYSARFLDHREAPFRKRKAFEHEREVRAVFAIWKDDIPEVGVCVPVQVAELIEQVVISPLAPSWFGEDVEDIAGRYGLNLPTCTSDLLVEPLHFTDSTIKRGSLKVDINS